MIKNFALRKFIVFNRLPIAVVLLALGFLLGFEVTWWVAWIPILIAILMVVAHFMVGPMTLLQAYMEMGDMEGAKALLGRVKKPEWLYKPLRSSYYMLRGQLSAATTDDLDQAEKDFKQSIASGMTRERCGGYGLPATWVHCGKKREYERSLRTPSSGRKTGSAR